MSQQAAPGDRPARPATSGRRWTSFVAADGGGDDGDRDDESKPVRGLHEQANPKHRLRVEHDPSTLLIHLSGEDGGGWTTIAVDRSTRQWAVAQGGRQSDTARGAYDSLYGPGRR